MVSLFSMVSSDTDELAGCATGPEVSTPFPTRTEETAGYTNVEVKSGDRKLASSLRYLCRFVSGANGKGVSDRLGPVATRLEYRL